MTREGTELAVTRLLLNVAPRATPPPDPEKLTLTGVVVDPTGAPLAGVSVAARAGDGTETLVSATTDERGAFTLAVGGPSSVTLHLADAKGHVLPTPGNADVDIEAGAIRQIAIAVEPKAAYAVGRK